MFLNLNETDYCLNDYDVIEFYTDEVRFCNKKWLL